MLGPSKTPRKALEAILAALENSTRAGCRVTKPRPFVVDRNICHFMWYSGGASEGLRSVGEEALPSSKSMCSILPIARLLRAGVLRTPALTLSWRRCRHSKRRRWKGAWWNHWLDSSRAGDNRGRLAHISVRSLRRFYGRGHSGLRPFALPRPDSPAPDNPCSCHQRGAARIEFAWPQTYARIRVSLKGTSTPINNV
jgi:hypothetical protein